MRAPAALRWFATVLGTATVILLAGAGPASAHAYLDGSDPSDGAVLNVAPQTVTLRFSESVQLAVTTVDVVDSAGRHTTPTALRIARSGTGTEAPSTISVSPPRLAPDTYRVTWHTVSSDDLHDTSGVFVFGLGTAPATASAPPADPLPAWGEVVLRWLLFAGTGVLLGGLVLALLADRVWARAAMVRRPLRCAVGGGGLALLAAPALLLDQSGGPGAAFRLLTQTSYGPRWVGREVALAVLVLVAGRLITRPIRRMLATVAAVGVLTLGATTALLGHVGAGSPAWIAVDSLHLLAATTWAGSLLVTAGAFVPGRAEQPDGGRRAVLLSFGAVAVGCVAVLTVTGLLLTGSRVATIDALLTSVYGQTLLVKVTLVGLATLLGLRSHLLLRAVRRGALSPNLRLEAGVLVAVLLAAAALTASAPALGPRYDPGHDVTGSILVAGNAPGRWTIGVRVDRADLPVASAGYGWDVAGHVGGTARPVVSTAPLAPWTDGLAVLAFAAWRRRSAVGRQPPDPVPGPEPTAADDRAVSIPAAVH